MMLNCYCTTTDLAREFSKFQTFNHCDSLEVLAATTGYKIVVSNVPHCETASVDLFETEIAQYKEIADVIVLLNTELHLPEFQMIKRINDSKVIFCLSGIINDTSVRQIFNGIWMDSYIVGHNAPHSWLLDTLDYQKVKDKSFDILLGCIKPHRDFVYDFILKNNLESNVIMTYRKLCTTDTVRDTETSGYILEPGVQSIDDNPIPLYGPVKYLDMITMTSAVLPISIYNQTAYSLVTETEYDNDWSFFTEKIAKPLYAKRLFIVISGHKFLENLRKLGFRTFDGIIDESYDQESDSETRWAMALEQLRSLICKPQAEILPKINDIVEHNFRLITSKSWYASWPQALLETLEKDIQNN